LSGAESRQSGQTYTEVFGQWMRDMAVKDERLVGHHAPLARFRYGRIRARNFRSVISDVRYREHMRSPLRRAWL